MIKKKKDTFTIRGEARKEDLSRQNTNPPNETDPKHRTTITASRKSLSPARLPDPSPGAQIRGQIPPSKQSNAARRSKRGGRARADDKKARGCVRGGGTGIDSIPYPAGEDRSIGWWCSRPPRGCRVPRLPACLPARAGSPRGPGARKEGRKLAAPAAAPWGVWDGEEVGDAAGLPVSTRVAPRYFL